jgi:WD40 repeat protein
MKRSRFTQQNELPLVAVLAASCFLSIVVTSNSVTPLAVCEFVDMVSQHNTETSALQTKALDEIRSAPIIPELVIQSGHSDEIISLVFSPDSRMLASSSADGTVRLWDVIQGRLVRTLDVSQYWVHSIAFSPDGNLVATGSGDNIVRVWDIRTGRQRMSLSGHTHAITALAFSHDGLMLASGSGMCGNASGIAAITLWDVRTAEKVGNLSIDRGNVIGLRFFNSNTLISVADGQESVIALWDLKNRKLAATIKSPIGSMRSLKLAMNKTNVALLGSYEVSRVGNTSSFSRMVKVWELPSGRQSQSFDVDKLGIRDIALLPDRNILWMFSAQHIYQKDTETGVMGEEFKGEFGQNIAIAPFGQTIAFVSRDKTIQLLGTMPGSTPRELPSASRSVRSMGFSNNGLLLASGMGDGSVSIWDIKQGNRIHSLQGHSDPVHSIAYDKQNEFLMTAAIDGQIFLLDAANGTRKDSLQMGTPKSGDTIETERLASRCEVNRVFIAAPRNLRLAGEIPPRHLMVSALSPTGNAVAYGGYSNFVSKWDLSNKTMDYIYQDKEKMSGVSALAFSSTGNLLAFGDESGRIRLGGFPQLTEVKKMEKHTQKINGLAFSPADEPFLASVSSDKSIIVWNTITGEPVQTKQGHAAPILALAYSPAGLHLATGGADNKINIWKMPSLELIGTLEGHSSAINTLTYSPDKQFLVSGSEDGTIRLWEAASGQELARLISLRDDTWFVVKPDGRFDTNNLEDLPGLSWIMPDSPLTPMPAEIFMRDYYEPRLLPRVLAGEKFRPIRPLADLNRVQPGVKILMIEKGATPDIAKVTVEVSAAEGSFQQNGKKVYKKTGVHDLRLYRNGQLVGQWPEAGQMTYRGLNTNSEIELNAWRAATEIKLDKSGKNIKTFTVRLPRREDLKEVSFSAYAFNLDRVKSKTAWQTYKVPTQLKPVAGRAYVITVGVSGNEDLLWRLNFAAEDAKLLQRTLVNELKDIGLYEKVVPVCLITTPPGSGNPTIQEGCSQFIRPTKENIRTVMDILAGRTVEAARLEPLPQNLRAEMRRVQPEDLVVLSFSSHGVTDEDGEFYLLPYDLGMDSAGKITPKLLKRSISSQELSLWLGPVDAEQLMMVVDACHAAAAVETDEFKPGPMGNPGLGQLSYDKGMPILVATQAANSAWAGRYSLLSLALAKEGIEEKRLGLNEALKYAEQRVPKLYEEKVGKEEKEKIQEPKLFNFKNPRQ